MTAAVKMQNIADDDRRGFDDLRAIRADVDGDGRFDTIRPRVYRVVQKPKRAAGRRARKIQNWIAFDLITSKGKRLESFFKYNYGTAEPGGSYWVYALKPAAVGNDDGTRNLIFYSGDDTTEETVILLNRGDRFVIHSRKSGDLGKF